MSNAASATMFFVLSPDGARYGPVSRDILLTWHEEGRLLPDTALEENITQRRLIVRDVAPMVQRLEPLEHIPWKTGAWSDPNWQQDSYQGPEPNRPRAQDDTDNRPARPLASPGITEYRARTLLSPNDASMGARRQVAMEGWVESITIPPQIVGPTNLRIKYRLRGQGLALPDGQATDLVLFLEYSPEGKTDPPGALVSRPYIPKGTTESTGRSIEANNIAVEAPVVSTSQTPTPPVTSTPGVENPPVSTPPLVTPPAPEPKDTIVHLTLTPQQASEGGEFEIALPNSGIVRSIYLPPGLVRQSRKLEFQGKGEAKLDGTNKNLRVYITVQS